MTFEELEADWEIWSNSPANSARFIEMLERCPAIDNAVFHDVSINSGVAVINGCILMSYDDIWLN